MSTASKPYRGFRFPAGIISEAVWQIKSCR
jgi:hypothetical protein